MSKVLKLNKYMHTLLISRKLDGFSVLTIRDELLTITDSFSDNVDARKYIYRQLLQMEKRGLLNTTGSGRNKTYHKTEYFDEVSFAPIQLRTEKVRAQSPSKLEQEDLKELVNEKAHCTAELEMALAGIDEYRNLASRLPKFESELLAKSEQARELSVQYNAKLEALIYAIELYKEQEAAC
ncbi:phage tail tape measure protein [Vibrio sp. RC27]